MTEEALKKGIQLNEELKELKELDEYLTEHYSHWWVLSFPKDHKIRLTNDKVREKIAQITKETIGDIKKQIEAL